MEVAHFNNKTTFMQIIKGLRLIMVIKTTLSNTFLSQMSSIPDVSTSKVILHLHEMNTTYRENLKVPVRR